MSIVNEACIEGRLGKDPECRYTPNGKAVTQFSVATQKRKLEDGVWADDGPAEWFNVKAWNKLAESVAESLRKGDVAHVHGRLETSTWDKDGVKQYRTELIANSVTRPLSLTQAAREAVAERANDDTSLNDLAF
jgi:single-strand DNA-binding protein